MALAHVCRTSNPLLSCFLSSLLCLLLQHTSKPQAKAAAQRPPEPGGTREVRPAVIEAAASAAATPTPPARTAGDGWQARKLRCTQAQTGRSCGSGGSTCPAQQWHLLPATTRRGPSATGSSSNSSRSTVTAAHRCAAADPTAVPSCRRLWPAARIAARGRAGASGSESEDSSVSAAPRASSAAVDAPPIPKRETWLAEELLPDAADDDEDDDAAAEFTGIIDTSARGPE